MAGGGTLGNSMLTGMNGCQGLSAAQQNMASPAGATIQPRPQVPMSPQMPPQGSGPNSMFWSPPFSGGPSNASSYATAQNPQLYGGQWNQLTQRMAGPQYSPIQPPQQAATTNPSWTNFMTQNGNFGGIF
jgi:hypothetical protein